MVDEEVKQPTRSNLKLVRSILGGVMLLVLGLGVGYRMGERITLTRISEVRVVEGKADLSLFWEVWQTLADTYLESEKIVDKDMVYGAIKGMTASLGDPYTSFLPPMEQKRTQEDLAGEFAGVGIQLGFVDETLAVMAPLPNQPAWRAGIKARDLILRIKDEKKGIDTDTRNMTAPGAVQIIRGQTGDPVTLTIYREGEQETKDYTLVRTTIVVPSVELAFVDEAGKKAESGEYAHIQVIRFGEKTKTEWNRAVNQILASRKSKGIVLDLRNNPGGYLRRAIDLAGEFVADGVVVQQQEREKTETFSVDHQGRLVGRPLVVLVNGGSASASEILAGALRDRVGAKLVGEKTFGKGTVQEVLELPGGAGLHVTIARWLLPGGANIHESGLTPDVEVKNGQPVEEGKEDKQLIKAIEVLKTELDI